MLTNEVLKRIRLYGLLVIIPLLWVNILIAVVIYLIWSIIPLIQGMITKRKRLVRFLITIVLISYPIWLVSTAIQNPTLADLGMMNTLFLGSSLGFLIVFILLTIYEVVLNKT